MLCFDCFECNSIIHRLLQVAAEVAVYMVDHTAKLYTSFAVLRILHTLVHIIPSDTFLYWLLHNKPTHATVVLPG